MSIIVRDMLGDPMTINAVWLYNMERLCDTSIRKIDV